MSNEEKNPTGGRRTFLLLVCGVLLLAFGWILSGETLEATQPAGSSGDETVATIDGEPIQQARLEEAAAEMLDQLELQKLQAQVRFDQERQKILKSTLDRVVEDELLALEAKARGVGVDELIAAEVTAKVTAVGDAEIDAFYTNLQSQRQGVPPKERIAEQIRTHLVQQGETTARQAFVDELKKKYAVEVMLSEPRIEVASEGFPSFGPEDAPVTIVEFSDFECPYCSRIVPTIEQVKKNYGDQVRVVFRQFPLNIHANAQKAAEASLCAQDQGKFWEMHDLMFQEQRQLGVDQLKDKAARLELDTAAFAECLDSGTHEAAVKADMRGGVIAGVSSTPSLFINGRLFTGAQPYPAVAAVIDEELARSGS